MSLFDKLVLPTIPEPLVCFRASFIVRLVYPIQAMS